MPRYIKDKIAGYYLYFTMACVIECMHVHASDSSYNRSMAAKFFVESNGDTKVTNKGKLSDREILIIQKFIKLNYKEMYEKWSKYSSEGFYKSKNI